MRKSRQHRDAKHLVLNRSELLRLLREAGKVPEGHRCFVVEVERGDEVINVNDVDGIVVSWGSPC